MPCLRTRQLFSKSSSKSEPLNRRHGFSRNGNWHTYDPYTTGYTRVLYSRTTSLRSCVHIVRSLVVCYTRVLAVRIVLWTQPSECALFSRVLSLPRPLDNGSDSTNGCIVQIGGRGSAMSWVQRARVAAVQCSSLEKDRRCPHHDCARKRARIRWLCRVDG